MQPTVPIYIHAEQSARDELAKDATPGGRTEFRADAEGRDPVVTEAADPLVVLAQQHVDQIHHTKALAGAVHAGQRLLRRQRRIPGFRRREAVVAVAARLWQ